MSNASISVLFEDNHLLVVAKPPLLATSGVESGGDSLLSRCKEYLKAKYHKPGNVFLGVVSRLDSMASGLLVFARTSKAAARLSAQFRDRTVDKSYLVLVQHRPGIPRTGVLQDWLWHDDASRRMRVGAAPPGCPAAKQAELSYQWVGHFPLGDLLSIRLITGRKHQIRVQLAEAKMPILGDRKYGSILPFPLGISLHCQSLRFAHPVRSEPMQFTLDPPEYWQVPFGDLR